jgi:putative endonuclease
MKSEIGKKGEDVASEYLINNGYSILERNFTCKIGEIDIIAKKGKSLIFAEVKAKLQQKRENTWLPELNITERKKEKLRKLVQYYLSANSLNAKEFPYQIDVIAVEFFPNGERQLRHHKIAVGDSS